jgi:predicted metal-binding transcription factor (methanogenesis marker protein 9)
MTRAQGSFPTTKTRYTAKSLFGGLCFSLFLVAAPAANAVDMSPKELKDRLNKIFYWHLSDELKLSQQQEKEAVAILESVQLKREEALKLREEALAELRKLPKHAGLDKTRPHLQQYLLSLETLAGLDREEYNSLKKALGEELLGRFYIIRDDVTTRVRKALRK